MHTATYVGMCSPAACGTSLLHLGNRGFAAYTAQFCRCTVLAMLGADIDALGTEHEINEYLNAAYDPRKRQSQTY